MTLKKVLVHLHLFYYNQTDYFIKKLKNITNCNWDLFVTFVEEDKNSINKIKKFKPDTIFKKVENYGYDIYPFIQIIRSVNLDNYDYILKLHTKNYQEKLWLNGFKKSGYWWRNELVDSLIKNKIRFIKNLNYLNKHPKTGFICSKIMLWELGTKFAEDTYLLEDELKLLDFKTKYKKYCAGTMFIARSDIYKFLQSNKIDSNKFSQSLKTKSTGTIAHAYERIFTIATNEYGYSVHTIKNYKAYFIKYIKTFLKYLFSIQHSDKKDKNKQIIILGLEIYI